MLFAGYLDQGWHHEYPDEWAVAFVRDEPQAADFRVAKAAGHPQAS